MNSPLRRPQAPDPVCKTGLEADFPQYAAGRLYSLLQYPNLRQNPKALEAAWDWAYNQVG